MTPDQQMMYFEDGTDPRTGKPYVTFNTAREAQDYTRRRQES